MARHKGVFLYEYIKSHAEYKETRLPSPKDQLYSSLNNECISEADYTHAKKVWDAFACQNLGDYSDVYLKIDVILLAGVYENFRLLCLDAYKIDPGWVYSTPRLAWNAMLRQTKVEMELFTDKTKYLLVYAVDMSVRANIMPRQIIANYRISMLARV